MLCPLDRTPLVMSERQGIEIDYCPTCRGVWLDRGELDKILERSAADIAPAAAPPPPQGYAPQGREQGYAPRYSDDDYRRHGRPKRRKSFLEELFD